MMEPLSMAVLAAAIFAGLALASLAALKGWQGWLELKRLELASSRDAGLSHGSGRIEIADLRERVRKLEAIAAGIDP